MPKRHIDSCKFGATCRHEDLPLIYTGPSTTSRLFWSITARSLRSPSARTDRSVASRPSCSSVRTSWTCSAPVRGLHPADLAFVLEGLEPDDRLQIWTALEPAQAAEAMVELDASVRGSLIGETNRSRLIKIAAALDPDDLA